MENFVSFVILIAFFYGRSLRKGGGRKHALWMTGVIFSDFTLIAYLVFSRDAMSKINPEMSGYLMMHLFFALFTVALYLMALFYGVRQLLGHNSRSELRAIDRWVVPTRVLTLITSLILQLTAP